MPKKRAPPKTSRTTPTSIIRNGLRSGRDFESILAEIRTTDPNISLGYVKQVARSLVRTGLLEKKYLNPKKIDVVKLAKERMLKKGGSGTHKYSEHLYTAVCENPAVNAMASIAKGKSGISDVEAQRFKEFMVGLALQIYNPTAGMRIVPLACTLISEIPYSEFEKSKR